MKYAAILSIKKLLTEKELVGAISNLIGFPLISMFNESIITKMDPMIVGIKKGFPPPYFLIYNDDRIPEM